MILCDIVQEHPPLPGSHVRFGLTMFLHRADLQLKRLLKSPTKHRRRAADLVATLGGEVLRASESAREQS